MTGSAPFVSMLLVQEARALLARLERVKPLALEETMVPAAAVDPAALRDIDRMLLLGRVRLRAQILGYLEWLESTTGVNSSAVEKQRRFAFLRLRMLAVLSQYDIFSEAMTQRSETETGVWLAGLDAVARDALEVPGHFVPPPVVCYLARDAGGAIRRARTRLPGGGENPVALIRLPRERMIGAGLASSLVHEAGHQGAALLDLLPPLRQYLDELAQTRSGQGDIWRIWKRWISEILADFWAIARVGVTSTMGLMSIVSLPKAFVFRASLDDPHPSPWVRVKLSTALGHALYPDPQWASLASFWDEVYPPTGLDPERGRLFSRLSGAIPEFVDALLSHAAPAFNGQSLGRAMHCADRNPAALDALYRRWTVDSKAISQTRPARAFAVVGRARLTQQITPQQECDIIASLLKHWALRGFFGTPVQSRSPTQVINPQSRRSIRPLRLATN